MKSNRLRIDKEESPWTVAVIPDRLADIRRELALYRAASAKEA